MTIKLVVVQVSSRLKKSSVCKPIDLMSVSSETDVEWFLRPLQTLRRTLLPPPRPYQQQKVENSRKLINKLTSQHLRLRLRAEPQW